MKYLIIFIILIILLINYTHKDIKETFIQDNKIFSIQKYFSNITPVKKYFLNCECVLKEYNRFNIEPSMEKFVKNIIHPYINNMNMYLNYNFIINNISNITEEIDNDKNRRYIIDFFMYEYNNFFVSRVIIDIILTFDNKTYLNKIILANANENNNSIKKNDIYGIDSDIVIKKQNIEKEKKKIEGVDNSSLEYSNTDINSYESNDCRKSSVRNKWILPKGSPDICSFPCKEESNCWDNYGVLYSCNKNKNCIGVNTSVTPKNFVPYQNPTITGTPANENKYIDLMKLTRGWIKPMWN